MDAIATGIESAVELIQAAQPIMTAGSKTSGVVGKSMTTEKDPVEGPTDAASFCVCLKESVEQKTLRENGIDQDLEREHVKSTEGEKIGWMIKSVNDPVFPEACCHGNGFPAIPNDLGSDPEKNGANRETSDMTTSISGKNSLPYSGNDGALLFGNESGTGLYSASKNMDVPLEGETVQALNDKAFIRKFDLAALKGMHHQKEVISNMTEGEMASADSGVGNLPPARDIKTSQGQAIPGQNALKSSDSFSFPQKLTSQENRKNIEGSGSSKSPVISGETFQTTKTEASLHSRALQTPLSNGLRSTESPVKSGETLQKTEIDAPLTSRVLQPHNLNGQASPENDSYQPTGIEPIKRDYYVLDDKQSPSMVIRENLLDSSSVRKEEGNGSQGKRFSQGLKEVFERSNSEQPGSAFFSAENKISTEKSWESRLVRPQAMMDQVVEGGIEMVRKGGGRLRMTLNPPNLGSLDMDIQVRNNKVEVLFLVDTAEIQSSLQANADLLKTALSQQGLKVDGYNVLIQGNTDHHSAYYSDDNASWLNSRREGGKDENRKDQQEQADGIMDLLKGSRFYPGDRYNRISLFI